MSRITGICSPNWGWMSPIRKPVALTIAGSDASGGAGIQADLKTFHQFGVYGEAAITLITVQNTRGVRARGMPGAGAGGGSDSRRHLSDIPPAAAKTGALGNRGDHRSRGGAGHGIFRFPWWWIP